MALGAAGIQNKAMRITSPIFLFVLLFALFVYSFNF